MLAYACICGCVWGVWCMFTDVQCFCECIVYTRLAYIWELECQQMSLSG